MRLGVLFSGGKDSTYAILKVRERNKVECLISIVSKNKESYMFHTPNIGITDLQAKAMGIPLVQVETQGKKEEELKDLEAAIRKAKEEYGIEGVVTGAIESVYQSERIQRVCNSLDIYCFNPLWKKDQEELLMEILKSNFKIVVSGIFAYPLDEKWLGRELDRDAVRELMKLEEEYGISPSGEGGELETTVLDAPIFAKRIEILSAQKHSKNNSGVFEIQKARLVGK